MDNKTLRNPNNSLEQPETPKNNPSRHADLRKGEVKQLPRHRKPKAKSQSHANPKDSPGEIRTPVSR